MICTLTNECHGNGSKMNIIFSFICMFCRSLFVLSYFFFWPLCCLFIFDLRILIITPLVSSDSSYLYVSKITIYIVRVSNNFTCIIKFPLMKDFPENKNRFSIKLKTKCRVELFSIYTWDVVSSTARHERDLNSQL